MLSFESFNGGIGYVTNCKFISTLFSFLSLIFLSLY